MFYTLDFYSSDSVTMNSRKIALQKPLSFFQQENNLGKTDCINFANTACDVS